MKNRWARMSLLGLIFAVLYFFSLPKTLFDAPYATVLEGRNGELLGARIAEDGQWRFPPSDGIPEKFKKCIVHYEDQYFYRHPGFNPVSLFRAVYQNLKAGKVVSGGSTLTMQVIRLSRKKSRTVIEKLIELVLATRLELRCSKEEILTLYASHAPFGGNVVGLESAAWRYFGRAPELMSWAEAAALAVLPNNPSMVYPGKNQIALLEKRNFLLKKLRENEIIDSLTYELSLTEPLPGAPNVLPQLAPHLLQHVQNEGRKGQKVMTSIRPELQKKALSVVENHFNDNKYNQIFNAAALIIDVETGEVLTYIGNTNGASEDHSFYVDIVPSCRSTGSILKPLLYAGMLDEGMITPRQLYPDIPTFFEGFSPKNYTETYEGAVPANEALARSLNVPSVYMLKDYSYEKFHFLLKKLGLQSIDKPASHYGLSLILGGAEASLWDLTAVYASMARTLNHFNQFVAPHRYDRRDFHGNVFSPATAGRQSKRKGKDVSGIMSAQSIWYTFEAMLDVNRPAEEASWRLFDSSRKVAWKTGTSFGFRDAWSIGVTPEYVVGVWVGNADGEGRPGLTGLQEAAPLMFDLFNLLPPTHWFARPADGIAKTYLCKHSGFRAGMYCAETIETHIPEKSLKANACPYCSVIHLDRSGKFRVSDHCYSASAMNHAKWFSLPPVMEWYYQKKDPFYKKMPEMLAACAGGQLTNKMEMIYPKANSVVYIPRKLDGTLSEIVLEVAHSRSGSKIHWHLDKSYLGTTTHFHQMAFFTQPGTHVLTLVDENGSVLETAFKVLERK